MEIHPPPGGCGQAALLLLLLLLGAVRQPCLSTCQALV